MNAEQVVRGVIESVDTLGPTPPSARELASLLDVAPATLYSSVPAMTDAYASARSAIVDEIAEPLTAALGGNSAEPIATILSSNPNRAVFVTQPTWDLPDSPTLQTARAEAGLSLGAVADGLALIGSRFTLRSLSERPITGDDFAPLIAKYRSGPVPTLPSDSGGSELVLRNAHAMIEEDCDDSTAALVQHESLDLVIVEPNGWSFRALGERTGIPISRLHRLGTRVDHMLGALSAFGEATSTWAKNLSDDASEASARICAMMMETGAVLALAELYKLGRSHVSEGLDQSQRAMFASVVPPAAVALLSSAMTRGQARDDAVACAAVFVDLDQHPDPDLGSATCVWRCDGGPGGPSTRAA